MNGFKTLISVLSLAALAACAPPDTASRTVMISDDSPMAVSAPGLRAVAPRYTVTNVYITVPRDLKVSEANMFYPIADIVWRGEPRGDRYAQVQSIFAEGMAKGTNPMRSGPEVVVEVEVTRFHCLTEKTRFTVGGVHSVRFNLTLRDAATGRVLDGPRQVVADVKASGGAQAIADDQAGRTQRVVIVDRLAEVIQRELTQPVPEELLAGADSSQPLDPALR